MNTRRPALACLAVVLNACTPSLPGEPVGAFDVTMALASNSCGDQAVILTDGYRFKAELRLDGQVAYWRTPDARALEGVLDDGVYRFVVSSIVASTDEQTMPLCSLFQTATLEATVRTVDADAGAGSADGGTSDAGADAGSSESLALDADYTLTIEQASGTDCSQQIAPMGPFTALPCKVTYSLTGTPRDSYP